MITIKAKLFEVKAKIPGYGVYYLRHLGAGDEADIINMLEDAKADIDEAQEKYQDISAKEKKLIKENKVEELAKLNSTPDYKEADAAYKKANQKLQKAINYSKKCQLELWRSDDPDAMKRLLKDFTTDQIIDFYRQVMQETNNG